MSQPKTVHLWLGTGRTLCDRRSKDEAVPASPGEFPFCGACAIVAEVLYNHSWHELRKIRAYPNPGDAVDSLRSTAWAESWDLDQLKAEIVAQYEYPHSKEQANADD